MKKSGLKLRHEFNNQYSHMKIPGFHDVIDAHERITPFIHKTPVMTSAGIDELLGGRFYFKCENFQKVGAFKFRGACNAVMSMDGEESRHGVVTHSSGNHAAALCLAARMKGIPAYIAMPRTAPEIKKAAVLSYGGKITFCEPNLAARESTKDGIVAETGAAFVPPYNHFDIISGQATAARELIDQAGELDLVMAPVGGGGLMSGTAISVREMLPGARIVGVEPAGADDACRSFKSGKIVPSVNPVTIADGLLTSLGELTFAVITRKVDDIVTVSEDSIVAAMRMIWERLKIVVEPSGAVPLAAVLEKKVEYEGLRTGMILSGGNVDLSKLPFNRTEDRQ